MGKNTLAFSIRSLLSLEISLHKTIDFIKVVTKDVNDWQPLHISFSGECGNCLLYETLST